jgi:hypothetical protein
VGQAWLRSDAARAFPPGPTSRNPATYEAAVAGLTDHDQHCGDAFCCPGTRYIVSRSRCDAEPSLNVSNRNAAQLLRALGLLPETGADAVLHEHGCSTLIWPHRSSLFWPHPGWGVVRA